MQNSRYGVKSEEWRFTHVFTHDTHLCLCKHGVSLEKYIENGTSGSLWVGNDWLRPKAHLLKFETKRTLIDFRWHKFLPLLGRALVQFKNHFWALNHRDLPYLLIMFVSFQDQFFLPLPSLLVLYCAHSESISTSAGGIPRTLLHILSPFTYVNHGLSTLGCFITTR